MPRTFNPEFRRRVLELVEVRPVRVVAVKLGLAEATVYRRKVRDLIDRGLQAETLDRRAHELATAKRLIMGHPGLFGSAAAADMVPGAQGRCGDRGPVIAARRAAFKVNTLVKQGSALRTAERFLRPTPSTCRAGI